MTAIVLWLGPIPAITAVLAGLRGRNVLGWYVLGVAAPVLAAIVAVLLPRRPGAAGDATGRVAPNQ